MTVRPLVILTASITILMGCAKDPASIEPTYVSPMQYHSYSCSQIEQEFHRISSRVQSATSNQKDAQDRDAVATGVGLVLFWPALFFLAGGDSEEELARLKGEYNALEQAAIQRDCAVMDTIRDQRQAQERAQREAKAENPANDDSPKPEF